MFPTQKAMSFFVQGFLKSFSSIFLDFEVEK